MLTFLLRLTSYYLPKTPIAASSAIHLRSWTQFIRTKFQRHMLLTVVFDAGSLTSNILQLTHWHHLMMQVDIST
jgi:hypothetical protein